jgi:S1-C subfamily serine protease
MVKKHALTSVVVAVALGAAGVGIAHARTSRSTAQTGVVVVNTNLAYQNGAAAGTGMVLTANGEVLTNNHVIRGATTIRVVIPQAGKTYSARVVGYDIAADVALLQLKNASGLATVSVGDSTKLEIGQTVTAVGNAGGTGTLIATTGKVTGLNRNITVSDDQGGTVQLNGLVETDASLHPGDSGGPLLDSNGRVIGMDSAASAGFSFQGAPSDGYAIPIARATSIAKQIVAGHASAQVHIGGTAFLGVQVQTSGYFVNGAYKAGELVMGVVPGSPTAKAGITAGVVITAVNGHAVASQAALVALLLPHHPGDTITLSWIDQASARHTASVTLASGPPQ